MVSTMTIAEFRFYYFTPLYEKTIAFYRDDLRFEIFRSWDRPDGERGTIFRSPNGAGLIEIEAGDVSPSIHGGFYIEVADIESLFARLVADGVRIEKPLGRTSYGHDNFKLFDPNGVEISFFRYGAPSAS